jgi:hypothetical protein
MKSFRFAGWRPTGVTPMDERVKSEIWDLATSMVIGVSLGGSMVFIGLILIGAIH